jgi:hypothetical protein
MTTTNIETRVREFTNLQNTSTEFLIDLAKLDNNIALGPLLDDLEQYCLSVRPIPVRLDNPYVIKGLLNGFRKRREEQARPVPFAVIIIGGWPFRRVLPNGAIETTNSFQHCAAFTDQKIARTAAKLLEPITNEPLRVTTITNERRPPETIHDKLADYGFPN